MSKKSNSNPNPFSPTAGKLGDQESPAPQMFNANDMPEGVTPAFSETNEMSDFGNPLKSAQIFDFDKLAKDGENAKGRSKNSGSIPVPEDISEAGEEEEFNGVALNKLTDQQRKAGLNAVDLAQMPKPSTNQAMAAAAYMQDGVMYIYLDFFDIYKADGYEHKAYAYAQRLAYGMSDAGIEQHGSVQPVDAKSKPPALLVQKGKQTYRTVYKLTPRI